MYEIIADPKDYQIDHLIEGVENATVEMTRDERDKWSKEIVLFSSRLTDFAAQAKRIADLMAGKETISATPRSLKTLKIELFKINEALSQAVDIANRLEADVVKK